MSETFDDINDKVGLISFCYIMSFLFLVVNVYGFITPEFWWLPAVTTAVALTLTASIKLFAGNSYSGFWQETHFDGLFWSNIFVSVVMPVYVWFNLIQGERMVIFCVAGLTVLITVVKVMKGIIYACNKKPLHKII